VIRVAIADDQQLVRAGFGMIIGAESDMTVVGEADDGPAAVQLARRSRPDVLLMDIRMPGPMDGLAATRALVSAGDVPTRVIMLTTFDSDDHVFAALDAGASGFLLKNSPPERLLDAIRTVAAGDSLLEPAVTTRVIAEFGRRRPRTQKVPELETLTERERDVLREIATGRSNTEIAARLFLSEATVKSHLGRILVKLGARDRVQAVVLAYETGFVSPGRSA
jgi:DNA-binding NarL/FixJ family response regulator